MLLNYLLIYLQKKINVKKSLILKKKLSKSRTHPSHALPAHVEKIDLKKRKTIKKKNSAATNEASSNTEDTAQSLGKHKFVFKYIQIHNHQGRCNMKTSCDVTFNRSIKFDTINYGSLFRGVCQRRAFHWPHALFLLGLNQSSLVPKRAEGSRSSWRFFSLGNGP